MAKKKNNKYWFSLGKRKKGWNPSSWQGWALIVLYFAVVGYKLVMVNMYASHYMETVLGAFPTFGAATIVLLLIAYYKGEKP